MSESDKFLVGHKYTRSRELLDLSEQIYEMVGPTDHQYEANEN